MQQARRALASMVVVGPRKLRRPILNPRVAPRSRHNDEVIERTPICLELTHQHVEITTREALAVACLKRPSFTPRCPSICGEDVDTLLGLARATSAVRMRVVEVRAGELRNQPLELDEVLRHRHLVVHGVGKSHGCLAATSRAPTATLFREPRIPWRWVTIEGPTSWV